MTDQTPFFVGYETLEGFMAACDPKRPLFLSRPTDLHSTNDVGFTYAHTYLLLSQVQGSLCCYWRMPLGRLAQIGGQPIDAKLYNQVVERADQADIEVRRLLRERVGVEPQAAVVAFPTELRYLNGTTDLLTFDKESNRFQPTA